MRDKALRIVSVRARPWTLPLVAPFVIAARSAHDARNVRVHVETEAGGSGVGASCPVGYVTGESVESVGEALAAVGPRFAGLPTDRLQPLLILADELLRDAPAARAGLEMALYDAWARHWGLPLRQHFGGASARVTTDLTIPLVPQGEAAALAGAAWAEGFRSLKIKVGDPEGPAADLARIGEIARAVPAVRLRIDANQAFAPDEAVTFARALLAAGTAIDLLEQPVAASDVAGLKYVRERAGMPVFADEAARTVPEVLRLLREDAVDGVNVKLMKSGIVGALTIIALCRASGKKLMLGCMLETGLGIAAAAQIAAGTGAFDYLDLDSHRLLRPIPGLSGGFTVEGEEIVMAEDAGAGLGVTLAAGGNDVTVREDPQAEAGSAWSPSVEYPAGFIPTAAPDTKQRELRRGRFALSSALVGIGLAVLATGTGLTALQTRWVQTVSWDESNCLLLALLAIYLVGLICEVVAATTGSIAHRTRTGRWSLAISLFIHDRLFSLCPPHLDTPW